MENRLKLTRISKFRKEYIDIFILISIPLFLLIINADWLSNKIGDTDTWFYYGHFLTIFENYPEIGAPPTDYYRTRLTYILPGALIYQIFSDKTARFLLMEITYITIILSFWYVVRRNTDRLAAFASASLLALDIYFVRSIGWQYVDAGVLVYQGLALAFLTAAPNRRYPSLYYALAGFSAVSMIFTHLVAGIFLFSFVFYLFFTISREGASYARFKAPLFFIFLGAGIAQTLYGLLNRYFFGHGFFFILEQVRIAKLEARTLAASLPLEVLAHSAPWLTIHGAALIGCIAGLINAIWRKRSILYFDFFCFTNAAILLSIVFMLELLHLTYFLSREGEYISLFIIPTYLAIGAVFFRPPATDWRITAAFIIGCACTLGYRLYYNGAPEAIPRFPVAWLALIAGAALATAVVWRRTTTIALAMTIFCGVSALTPWGFMRDDSITRAGLLIRTVAGNRIPRFYFDINDPEKPIFWSIIATFTDRGWWRHGEHYPDFSNIVWPPYYDFHSGDVVVVLSGADENADTARAALSNYVAAVSVLGTFKVQRSGAPFWVHCFEISMPNSGSAH